MPVIRPTNLASLLILAAAFSGCGCGARETTVIDPATVYRLAAPISGASVAVYDHTDAAGNDVYRVLPGTVTLPAGDFVAPPPQKPSTRP